MIQCLLETPSSYNTALAINVPRMRKRNWLLFDVVPLPSSIKAGWAPPKSEWAHILYVSVSNTLSFYFIHVCN